MAGSADGAIDHGPADPVRTPTSIDPETWSTLYAELHGPGLKGIVDTLRGVSYLRQIVVSISGTDAERTEYEDMRALFDGVRTVDGAPPILLWNSGPRVKALYD